MDLLDSYFLVSRDSILYRANISALSSVIFFKESKDELYDYLKSVEDSIQALTATIDLVLIPREEMKATYTTKESVNELTNNGNYVLCGDAKKAADTLKTNAYISGTWYNDQLDVCMDNLNDAYKRNVGMIMNTVKDGAHIDNKKAGKAPGKGAFITGKWKDNW